MDFGISGKTALVFGGGSGLGRAICLGLAAEGVNIAFAGRNAEHLAETAALLAGLGANSLQLVWDLTDPAGIARHIAGIEAALGPVDILVNNTGGPPPTTAAGQPAALWASQFNAMVLPVITITDHILPGMRARGFGRIITSTSSGVIAPIPGLAISNTLRAALLGWSKTLATEVAKDGVTVNIVVPGRIATARIAALDGAKAKREGRTLDDVTAQSIAGIPAGRTGRPEEYADMVTFLASARAAYITGSVFRVDGGMIPSA